MYWSKIIAESDSDGMGANAPSSAFGSGEFLKSALTAARVGTWRFDLETGSTTWDRVTSLIFGMDPKERDVASPPPVHPDDLDVVFASLQQASSTGASREMMFRGFRADGEMRWLRAQANTPQPGDRYIEGIISDVTEERLAHEASLETQRHLQALIDSLPGAAYRCSLKPYWHINFMSDAAEALTGVPAREFVARRRTWESVVFDADREVVTRAVKRGISECSPFSIRYRIVHTSGAVRWVSERGAIVYDTAGRPVSVEGFIGDVTAEVEALEQSRKAEETFRLASRATLDLIYDWDLASDQLLWNDALESRMGYGHGDLGSTGSWWADKLHPDDRQLVLADVDHVLDSGRDQYAGEYRFRRADGAYAHVFDRAYVIRDGDGKPIRMVGAMQDLTERQAAITAQEESEAVNRSIVDASPDCIQLLDLQGRVLFMNGPGAHAMEISDPSLIYGLAWADLWPPEARRLVLEAAATACTGDVGRFSAERPTAKGTMKWWDVVVSPVMSDDGSPTKLVCISRDCTEQRAAEEQLRHNATHDALTGLPNRTLFQERLAAGVDKSIRTGRNLGVMFLDLDDFKQTNDTLGHDAGDALLKSVGERLERAVLPGDTVARFGGDEFAIIMEGIDGQGELEARAARVSDHLAAPVVDEGRLLDCRASMGVSLFPDHGTSSAELLKNADIALYVSKGLRMGLTVYNAKQRADLQRRASMINTARDAVRDSRVYPYYQPKLCLRSRKVEGFEALLRWHDRSGQVQLPGMISAAFQEFEVATALSNRIIDLVIADMRRWHDSGIDFGHVAINASAAEFRRDDFAERLLERLAAAKLPPARLQLEVTETVFLGRGAEAVERALQLLSREGVTIALDDFGTGYASLRHLREFPVDVIKIDRSFVRDIENDRDDAAIVDAVIQLSKSMGIKVVAEGIENEEQARLLSLIGCDAGQGFLFSRAVPFAEASLMLPQRRHKHLAA